MIRPLRRFLVFLIIFSISLISSNLYAGIRIGLPDDVYYHRFASSVKGPEATWSNPAALGLDHAFHIQYITTFEKGDFSGSWGTVMTGDGFGIAYRSVENFMGEKYNEYIFGAGLAVGDKIYCGGSYQNIKQGFDYFNKRHFWNIGFFLDTKKQLTFGALFSNLNRGKIDDTITDIEELYSLSYETPNRKFVLSMEATLSSEQSLSSAKYNYGLEYYPSPKLSIFANINNDQFYQIGLRYNFGDYFVGAQGRGDKNSNPLGTSIYAGYVRPIPQ